MKVTGLPVVKLLAAYLQTNPGPTARSETHKVLGLIARTSEDEAVREKTRGLSTHASIIINGNK
jgi:hypothetical protein